MADFVQDLINAIGLGSIYALAALGIALIFGVMRLINFAYGELITTAAYALWVVSAWPTWTGVVVAVVSAALLAVLMERVAFRPVRDAAGATLLVTSFFVSSLVQNTMILVLGSRPKSISILPSLLNTVEIGPVSVQLLDLASTVVGIVLLVAVALFLKRTLLGIQIRAAAENFTMARRLGVRADRVIATAFAMSGMLGAIVAVFLVARTGNIHPLLGLQPTVIGFVATALGGFSLTGAVAGAYVIGALTVGLQVVLPSDMAAYRDAFVFAAVLLILLWRPEGIVPSRLEGGRA